MKDLSSLGADLAALAATMPTERPAEPFPRKIVAPAPREPEAQFSFSLRAILRKATASPCSRCADMTARAFALLALKDRGLDVKDDDLLNLRKDRRPKLGDRGTAAGRHVGAVWGL